MNPDSLYKEEQATSPTYKTLDIYTNFDSYILISGEVYIWVLEKEHSTICFGTACTVCLDK